MPAQWTARIIGQMHLNDITAKQLAAEANLHPKYLSHVLNSNESPKGTEEKLTAALERIIARKSQEAGS